MSKTKLPRDIQQQCLWIVRGYDRCRKEYIERRNDILNASGGGNFTTYSVTVGKDKNGKPIKEERRAYTGGSHNASRTTEEKEMQLEGLERTLAFRQMKAVEHARDRIGAGLPDMLAHYLREAIMQNCINGRRYTFERLYTVGISRRSFYRYRDAFFWDIANELGLI